MAEATVSDDLDRFHRGCAAICNNRAWELSLLEASPARDEEMLQAAYASAWHWSQIGNELHWARAAVLLAEVHALLGHGEQAWVYAERVRSFFAQVQAPDWEAALVLAIHAHAAFASGRAEEHRASYERATIALQAIADEEERRIVSRTFAIVPKP